MSVQYETSPEGLADPSHHFQQALEAVAEVARKLKVERDEAVKNSDVLRNIIQGTVTARNSALNDLTEMERERDEAREAFQELWQLAEPHLGDLSEEQLARWHVAGGFSQKSQTKQ